MKTLLHFIVTFALCSLLFPQEKEQNVTVILHFDEELSQTEQSLYIASFCPWVSGFEQNIWDSVQTQKGQKDIMLHAYAPPRGTFFRILFSKEGPNELCVYANENDTVEVKVEHTDVGKPLYKKALRGQYHNDYMEFSNAGRELWGKRRMLETEKNIDSLTILNNKMIEFYREYFNHTKHFNIASTCITILRTQFANILSEDTILALRKQFVETYPDDPRTSLNYGNNRKQTQNGIKVAQRLKEINIERINYERTKQQTMIGRTLNLNLYGTNGDKIAISNLTECQYIYVDIWASWCKPCIAQFPYIKKALDKYPQDLKVYAISIDKNHKAWEKSIAKDPLKSFVNVIGTDNDWNLLKEVKDLGVERIPRNFLLDKNRKIIAKDLHDDRLIEVLDSLLHK